MSDGACLFRQAPFSRLEPWRSYATRPIYLFLHPCSRQTGRLKVWCHWLARCSHLLLDIRFLPSGCEPRVLIDGIASAILGKPEALSARQVSTP
ncbi:hypothetical protein D7S89_25845 [Trinickia fusca]|uniref:Uncharacterized protein n=1 Tax=Trinickia fusca TaxID=2419777 RepID=A0A494X6Z9_9BURK|nr:hypothetical protein D7S89_25845 [Trinickia fusca]